MNVILYMAITVNGYIAKEDDDTSWVTENDWKRFVHLAKEKGNIVIGKRTYEQMLKRDEFPMAECHNIVMTSKSFENKWGDHVVFTDKDPSGIKELITEKGCSEVLLAGGGHLNGSFMKAGLIDEIYLDIEPTIFGKGIKLFEGSDFENKLELIEHPKVDGNEVLLHYRVKK